MPPKTDDAVTSAMQRALQLAAQGEGFVEPNPMVGCVIINDGVIVGEGWHEQFGSHHAEVNALAAAGDRARGATLVVTLEPCCHTGKTPPCSQAVIEAGVARVVIACRDPFPKVDGGGIAALESAGIPCTIGVGQAEAQRLMAPYLMRVEQGRPWVIAKWAMTLDGKIATATGNSQWISGEASRSVVHQLRGRVEAVLAGAGTLVVDNPLLNARPKGPRTPTRIVVAGDRPLPNDRKLWSSLNAGPVLVAVGENYPTEAAQGLIDQGVEVLTANVEDLLKELALRGVTNVLVEGGARLLGDLFDRQLVDEVHTFIAPKITGGAAAPSPVGGDGVPLMKQAMALIHTQSQTLGDDLYLSGRIAR